MAQGAPAFAPGGPVGPKAEQRPLGARMARWFHRLDLYHAGEGRERAGKQPLYMLSGRSYHRALRLLCNASAAPAQLGQVALEEALQREGVAGNHWFALEHRVYRSLREQGRLTMEAGTNQKLSRLRTDPTVPGVGEG